MVIDKDKFFFFVTFIMVFSGLLGLFFFILKIKANLADPLRASPESAGTFSLLWLPSINTLFQLVLKQVQAF